MWLHWRALRQFGETPVSDSELVRVDKETPSLTCPICLSTLKAPMVPACGHSVCESCVFRMTGLAGVMTDGIRRSGDSRCPVCRQHTPWYFPCRALNSVVSPTAVYTHSSMVVADQRLFGRQLYLDVRVNVTAKKRRPKNVFEWCCQWMTVPWTEWLLRLTLLAIGSCLYLSMSWIYDAMAVGAGAAGSAFLIREARKNGWESVRWEGLALCLAIFLVVCSVAHFLSTAAFWLLPAATVVGFFYSDAIMQELWRR